MTNQTNIVTMNINSEAEQSLINQMINLETRRKESLVPGSSDYVVMTACWIDGDFICVTDYPISDEMHEALKAA